MFLPKIFQIPQMFGQNRGKIYRFINIIVAVPQSGHKK